MCQGEGGAQGVYGSYVCAIGVQQREPSVLHLIVVAVTGECGASHSASFPALSLRQCGGEEGSLNSACHKSVHGPVASVTAP